VKRKSNASTARKKQACKVEAIFTLVEIVNKEPVTSKMEYDISSGRKDWLMASKSLSGDEKRATVNEECPKCQYKLMFFKTAQLRSADEGQTIFYECVKCS
jgi:DNA-directed RNA polymerase subunit M/transcription elongation factor TFIIS